VFPLSKIGEVQKSVNGYYLSIDWDPVIKHDWIEAYLNVLYFNKRSAELSDAWEDIHALILYVDRTAYTHLSELPWWEYSVALEWIESHIWVPDRFDLTLANASRVLQRWQDFYQYLEKIGIRVDVASVNQAFQKVCSGDQLKLIKKIPYTGEEFWMGVTKGESGRVVDFTMA
jgi:hypothetical protein